MGTLLQNVTYADFYFNNWRGPSRLVLAPNARGDRATGIFTNPSRHPSRGLSRSPDRRLLPHGLLLEPFNRNIPTHLLNNPRDSFIEKQPGDFKKVQSLASSRLQTIFSKRLDKHYSIKAWLRARKERGISSVGRALQWHCRGQRFEPAILHKQG